MLVPGRAGAPGAGRRGRGRGAGAGGRAQPAAGAAVMLLLVALWGLWEVGGNLEWGLRTSISPGAGYEPSGELLPGTEMQELAIEPFVKLARGFLTAAECDHLRALVEDRLPARGLVLPREAEERNSSNALNFGMEGETMGVNTGRGHQVPRRYDRTVAVVEARAARLAGALESHGEPLKVWRYDEGTEWTAHGDCKKRPSSKDMAKWAEEGQQRTVTVLLYIGEPDEGGETVFPERQDWAPGVEPWGGGTTRHAPGLAWRPSRARGTRLRSSTSWERVPAPWPRCRTHWPCTRRAQSCAGPCGSRRSGTGRHPIFRSAGKPGHAAAGMGGIRGR